jgi:hypothetical protein
MARSQTIKITSAQFFGGYVEPPRDPAHAKSWQPSKKSKGRILKLAKKEKERLDRIKGP